LSFRCAIPLKERNEVHKAEGEVLQAEIEKPGVPNEQAMQAALEKMWR
jgi:hypothetical protein